jgi:hypothetical protein
VRLRHLTAAPGPRASQLFDLGTDDDRLGERPRRLRWRIDSADLGLQPVEVTLETRRSADQHVGGRLLAEVGERVVAASPGERDLPMVTGLALAAAGVALLTLATTDSSYVTILPALLRWGIGLGLVTPAVVAAAMSAVPSARAGLASAVNNTTRQAGGAIGIAGFDALAGQPGRTASSRAFTPPP